MIRTYGGALIDSDQRVLLREPRGHYYGYVWTFAKGTPDPGETPQETALREVREETGWEGTPIAWLPGEFSSTSSVSRYLLLSPFENHYEWDKETVRIEWVDETEARIKIALTTNEQGRSRDLDVLSAAFAQFKLSLNC